MTTLLTAKIQKGTAIPSAAMTRPPSAGPAARIEADAVQGRCAVKLLPEYEKRSGGPPSGRGERAAHAQHEGRRQQERRGREVQRNQAGENHGDGQNREF